MTKEVEEAICDLRRISNRYRTNTLGVTISNTIDTVLAELEKQEKLLMEATEHAIGMYNQGRADAELEKPKEMTAKEFIEVMSGECVKHNECGKCEFVTYCKSNYSEDIEECITIAEKLRANEIKEESK